MERSLQTKAFVIHSFMTATRVFFSLLGQSYWQKGFNSRKENPTLRHDFSENIESYVRIAIIVMIPLGVLLDILCWRWRKAANALIYYELASTIIQAFAP